MLSSETIKSNTVNKIILCSYADILKKGKVHLYPGFNPSSNSSSNPNPNPSSNPNPNPSFNPNPKPSPSFNSSKEYCPNLIPTLISSSISDTMVSDIELDIYKYESRQSKKNKKTQMNETDFLNPTWKLPGGKKYQKDGVRLENAFYNGLPKKIKNNISTNVKPRYSNGNVIVEFDMIFQSNSSKRIISFEIKGVNPNTINNLDRQQKLIAQAIRQKKYLEENFSDYKVDCVYCFVTGKIKNEILKKSEPKPETNSDSDSHSHSDSDSESESEWKSITIVKHNPLLDPEFIKKIKSNNIKVAIGETPQQCAKNALIMLNLLR